MQQLFDLRMEHKHYLMQLGMRYMYILIVYTELNHKPDSEVQVQT